MSKVGSSSVFKSIKEAGIFVPVFHTRVLTDEMISKGELKKRDVINGTFQCMENVQLRNLATSSNLHVRWKIISLVRDPIARNVSVFFQNLDVYGFNDLSKISSAALIDSFMNEFDHDRPLECFDKEVLVITGSNILSLPFDKEAGFSVFTTANFDFLVLRMEDMNQVGQEALRTFTGYKSLRLVTANLGNDKEYSELYKEFRKNINFCEKYLDEVYESEYAKAFYSDSHLTSLKAKWLKPESRR